MNCLRQVLACGAVLVAMAAGCGDNGQQPDELGNISLQSMTVPSDVTAIHVTVTALDIESTVEGDLVFSGGVWSGTVLNVPVGTLRTVTAFGYNVAETLIYKGSTSNVSVFSGEVTSLVVVLLPYPPDPGGPGLNTPPHFVELVHPATMATDATAELTAKAVDPDVVAMLTYTWSSTPAGTFTDGNVDGDGDGHVVQNRVSGDPVVVLYTPPASFTGFALIQVSVSDGQLTATTTFPIAVGAGVFPAIQFDVMPQLAITSIDRQVLMPNGSTEITYELTNPGTDWTPEPMYVDATWTDDCGGVFDPATQYVVISRNATESRTVKYTASTNVPNVVDQCTLKLSLVDIAGASMWSEIIVWVEEPLAVFITSGAIDGAAFAGESAAADVYCQSHVATSGLPQGTYKALLSFDEISAMDRIVDGPYVRGYDGTAIARNKAELFGTTPSTYLLNAVDLDEDGATVGGNVFTGTEADGSTAGARCANWTSSSSSVSAMGGLSGATDTNWVAYGAFACDLPAHVYCFQQTHLRE